MSQTITDRERLTRYRVTLDLMIDDSSCTNPEDWNWYNLLQLERNEKIEAYVTVRDFELPHFIGYIHEQIINALKPHRLQHLLSVFRGIWCIYHNPSFLQYVICESLPTQKYRIRTKKTTHLHSGNVPRMHRGSSVRRVPFRR